MDLVSKGFNRMRNPRRVPAEGEEEGAPTSLDPPLPAEDVKRSESARGWGPDQQEERLKLMSMLKEEYGSGAEEEGKGGDDSAMMREESGAGQELSGEEGGNDESYGSGEEGRDDSAMLSDEEWVAQMGGSGKDAEQDAETQEGRQQHAISVTREEVAKRRVVGGTVSGYKHRHELQATLERKAALKFIRDRKADVTNRERVMYEADDKVATIKSHIEEIDSKAGKMRSDARKLFEEDQFVNRDRISIVNARIDALMKRRFEEQENLDVEAEVAYVARREFNNAQIELRRVEELEEELVREEDAASAEARMLAELRAEKETQAALRFEKLRSKRVQAKEEGQRAGAEKTSIAVRDAKAGRVAALKRVKEDRTRQMESEQKFGEVKEAERKKRVDALLNLKGNLGAVQDQIQGSNARKMKKQKAIEERRAAEKSEILAAGGNPYAVWRQQDVERKEQQKQEARAAAMKAQENRLLEQITAEERRRRAADDVERHHKEVMKDFQKEMGGQAKREKVQKYMIDRTVGGKDVLDPTGREARIYPSKVTVLKDHKFGLGTTPYPPGAAPGADVPPGFPRGYEKDDTAGVDGEGWRVSQKDRRVEKMSMKYPYESFNSTLVGSKFLGETRSIKNRDRKTMAEVELVETLGKDTLQVGLPRDDSSAPGGDDEGSRVPAAAKPRLDETHAVPEFTGLWSAEGAIGNSPKKRQNMSKLEQRYMEEALSRKKAGYGWIEKQVVWGREFKGTAFVPSEKGRDVPGVLFKDFVPGKVYKRKVTLTNASLAFNTFKLLELPDAVKDFFEISYTHPGAMSPGMACDMYIRFEPKINEDILEHIPLLCQTGPQSIPLTCLTKRADLSAKSTNIEFDVIMGEFNTIQIVLVNHGALDVPIAVKQLASMPPDMSPETVAAHLADAEANNLYAEEPADTLAYAVENVAANYATTKIDLTFTPVHPGETVVPLHLCLPKGMSVPQSPDLLVLVHLRAHEVPIYILHEVMDFKCCCYGMAYSQIIPVCNRGKVALKASLQVSKELHGFVTFSPDMAYVQGQERGGKAGRFDFRMRFEPEGKLLDRCKEYLVEGPTGLMDIIEIPVRVLVPDQTLPIYFTFRVQLTTGALKFSQEEIDFGECAVMDSVSVKLGVTNVGELPQRVGFMKLPREITVQPNTGFRALLPGETSIFDVIFCPYSNIDYSFKITATTSANARYDLSCRAKGSQPPIQFTCTNFQLRSCIPTDRIQQSFFCTNISKTDSATMELLVPRGSGIKISPIVATIEPGQTARFQVDFCPPYQPPHLSEVMRALAGGRSSAELVKEKKKGEEGEEGEEGAEVGEAGGEEEAAEGAEEGAGEGEEGEEVKERSEPPGGETMLTEDEERVRNALLVSSDRSVEGEDWSVHDRWQIPVLLQKGTPMFLEVSTTTVMPVIVGRVKGKTMRSTVGKDGVETPPLVDFGKLPVGQESVVTINLTNVSATGTFVNAHLFDPFGPFVLLKSPMYMEAGTSQTITIGFRPRKEATTRENHCLEFMGGRLRYCLAGIGVSPHFAVEGLEVDNGMVDMGDVIAGGEIAKRFILRNNSPFEVTYTVDIRNVGEINDSQLLPIDCVPSKKAVPAGGEEEVTMTFTADTESLQYAAIVRIIVPNQKEKLEYRVVGRCWAQGAFLCDPSPTARSAPLVLDRFKDQAEKLEDAAAIKLEHTFPVLAATSREPSELTLRIGNCGGGTVEIVWDNLADVQALGFSLDPAPGKASAGSAEDFVIKYTPGGGMPLSVRRKPQSCLPVSRTRLVHGNAQAPAWRQGSCLWARREPRCTRPARGTPTVMTEVCSQHDAADLLSAHAQMWNDVVLLGSLRGGDPAPSGGAVPVHIKLRGFLPAAE